MPSASPARPPLFTVVSACYNVARYLPAFIASIDAQDVDPALLEVIMVDDGSSDDTLQVLNAWAERRPGVVRVITQENAGQGAARNTGMAQATGEWITFPDPDDVLDPDYFSRAAAAVRRHPKIHMVATSRWLLNDHTGGLSDVHPLRAQFRSEGVYNLAVNHTFFHGGAVASFMRTDRIRTEGLTFDGRIRPNFEDGHFSARYLLSVAEPKVAFLTTRYHYRKRADGSSTLQNALGDRRRYSDVLRHGYLSVLTEAVRVRGHVPLWLQNFVLYELSYYVGREDAAVGTLAPLDVREEFHALLAEITALLDPVAIRSYRRTSMSTTTRVALEHGWRSEPWVQPYVVASDHDTGRDLVRISYRYTGAAPQERIMLGERQVEPTAAKVRDVMIQGRAVVHERIIWIPLKRVRVELDGRPAQFLPADPPLAHPVLRPQDLGKDPLAHRSRARTGPLGVRDRITLTLAHSKPVRDKYRDAWVLIDRVHNSDDSAEHLFKHLRAEEPDINAWFVVEEDTPCWHRLRAEYGNRIVAHGSDTWKLLMLNATRLISSHADQAIVRPPALRAFGSPKAKFVFLQHGVIKDDLSGWLNGRPIDLFVTSTHGEYNSVVDDHTAYRFTSRETVLTGLPRFDMLHRAGAAFPPEKRDLILISPTWRDNLVAPLRPGSQRRSAYDWITETPYWQNWSGLILSEDLERLGREQGLSVALLPHPNMDEALEAMELPDHVKRFSFNSDVDVREIFARAAVLVTDYSSTAFNSAYIGRPVVYFQFDQKPGQESRHVGLPGYFDYARDGFGPVVHEIAEAEAEIRATVEHGRESREPWRARIEETFPMRDDNNSRRVTREIKKMARPTKVRFVRTDEA
ncbi:bifunctional glycosyltransferase/CDP-glycerol:glycerophosphate glycerophosphotransferase [Nocardioides yefusunii]|uniref:CDP-glycerol glycerophosphotransferase family protein n=1 Tax=Nocardioides yefusunii TaxID=2500546 RepID=A0ABW1QSV6_9ACTN|nr:CDP-glycerol glycerophosphotransferase family protein [Nocardioides yefusunii]